MAEDPLKAFWERLDRSRFRSRFRLTDADRAYLALRGWREIEAQARARVMKHLAPAHPEKDGSQTPMRGHVVFLAQHATGTCCRGCLCKWHHIPQGRELTPIQVDYVVGVLVGWLRRQAGDLSHYLTQGELPF